MLGRLETVDVVARAEPSSDALLGFEIVDSGTCWRPSPKKFWRIALAIRELAFDTCRRMSTQIRRASGNVSVRIPQSDGLPSPVPWYSFCLP